MLCFLPPCFFSPLESAISFEVFSAEILLKFRPTAIIISVREISLIHVGIFFIQKSLKLTHLESKGISVGLDNLTSLNLITVCNFQRE